MERKPPAQDFLMRCKRRGYNVEFFQPHHVPRMNSHVASNTHSANNVLEQLLTSVRHKTYVSTHPIPIGPPVKVDDSIVKGLDPVQTVVKDKKKFKAMYNTMCQSEHISNLTVEDIDKLSESVQNEPVVPIHSSVLAYAQVCSLDPDPHFSSHYNFYYGGNMAITELQGRKIIFHAVQDEPSKLRVVIPNMNEESRFDISHVDHQMEESPIYQIDSFSSMILVRQKKSCGLLKFNFDEGATLEQIGVVKTPDVFVSSCYNSFKQNEFATVSPNSAIEIHDVQGKIKRSVEVEGVKDNWGHVHYHDQNVLMFADRDSISLCDLREPESQSLQWEVKNQAEVCDDVFAAARGKFLHYVSTKHYIMSLDIRKGFHQRWAHGLSNSPYLLNVTSNVSQDDSIVIGCQSTGGIVFLENSSVGEFTSDILSPPVRLPSHRETLHLARTKSHLLSPIISSRFSLSLTGLTSTSYGHSDKIHVFSCNSVGDLFEQFISPISQSESSVEPLSGSDLESLHQWESQCLQHYSGAEHTFKANFVVSMKHLTSLFDDSSDSSSDEPSTPPEITSPLQPWNKSKKTLKGFKDMLAPKLLDHWNIDEEEEWCDASEEEIIDEDSDSDESSDELDDVDVKVRQWLDKSVDKSWLEPTPKYL